jgi:DNA-binding GntR family transcriptional regulator
MHLIISEKLRKQIDTGIYAEGDQLPSEFDLGQLFGVSRTTVRRAIANLINQGLVETQQGKGIFVKKQQKISFSLSAPFTFFDTELTRQGRVGIIKNVRFERIAAPRDIRNRLQLEGDQPYVFYQEKLILADDLTIALDLVHYPEPIGNQLADLLPNGFTYRTLHHNGYPIHAAKVSIESHPASYETSEHLGVSLGAPLLVYRYIASDKEGIPLVCGETISRADCTFYSADLTEEQIVRRRERSSLSNDV